MLGFLVEGAGRPLLLARGLPKAFLQKPPCPGSGPLRTMKMLFHKTIESAPGNAFPYKDRPLALSKDG